MASKAPRGRLPLIALPSAAIAFRQVFADWVFMWVLAYTVFFGCKWLTWRRHAGSHAGRLRSLAYLLLWPGMDAESFLHKTPVSPPSSRNLVGAFAKLVLGAALLWGAPGLVDSTPLLAGWAGMAGILLLLHFGVFSLLAYGYQAAGIAANPLMNRPFSSRSLSDFWSRRWNAAFHALAHDFIFRPLVHRIGTIGSTLAVFAISGIVHDLVISLPARGGYGWPTAYFLLQGLSVLFERSGPGRTLGLGRGRRGRVFMLAVTCLPLPWLFHSTFVNNIILPLLNTIGGTWRAL